MEKLLITGAGGFIGSHLVEKCIEEGYAVRAFVHYNSKNNWGWLEQSKYINEIEVLSGDIRDFDSVHNAMNTCDTVFHLAALIGIPYSYVTPLAYIKTNVEGTYNILQSAKMLGTKNIIITSTSETYGTAKYVPIDEKHIHFGQSPYSASKIAADQLAISYLKSFELPVKIVRPFNTYGPRQSARAIIPTIIMQILLGKEKISLGNTTPTRDLTYVKDTVSGFINILKCDKLLGETINIGMNQEITIANLVNLISEIMESNVEIISDAQRIRPENSEVKRLLCDNSKLVNNTNWLPKYDLSTGLIETIEWLKNNIDLYKTETYNV